MHEDASLANAEEPIATSSTADVAAARRDLERRKPRVGLQDGEDIAGGQVPGCVIRQARGRMMCGPLGKQSSNFSRGRDRQLFGQILLGRRVIRRGAVD